MRRFVIGVSTDEQWRALKPLFEPLAFVELRQCDLAQFTAEAKLDLEIVSPLYHEIVGGRPIVGKAQILPTYRIRGLAPWVAFLPSLEYEWDVRYDEEGNPGLYYFRRTSPAQDTKYEFEVFFQRLAEFDSYYPERVRRVGFHAEMIFAKELVLEVMPAVAEVLSAHRSFFESSDSAEKETVGVSEAIATLRQWLGRYEVSAVILPDGEILEPPWAPAYWLSDVFRCGEWAGAELVSHGDALLILFSGAIGIESTHEASEQKIGASLEISDPKSLIVIRTPRNSECRVWVYSTGKLEFFCGTLQPL